MDKMGCLHQSPNWWHGRQTLAEIKRMKPEFEQLMAQTRQCMTAHPELANDVTGAIQCETIHPATLSNFSRFTFHTHPHGNIDYPSPQDIKTTNKLKKKYLVIGLASKNQIVVFSNKDNFKNIVARF